MKNRKESGVDTLETAWQAYLDAAKAAAENVAAELREYVENGVAPDGKPLFSLDFAVESESSRHRGPHRNLLSQGRPSVKVHGGDGAADQRVDLRPYLWSQVCYQDRSGKKLPVCDVMYSMMPQVDPSTGNRHACAYRICIAPSGSDGYDAPNKLIKPIGELRSDMDPSVIATLKTEVASEIKYYCAKNSIDVRTSAKLPAALASGREAGSDE